MAGDDVEGADRDVFHSHRGRSAVLAFLWRSGGSTDRHRRSYKLDLRVGGKCGISSGESSNRS